jgi:cytochrome d ubiquinol oxidase subunit II
MQKGKNMTLIDVVAFFLAVALILYAVLGGADFGAGIIELTSSKAFRSKHRKLISSAMGPVWEANHVWLILAVVILFMGFPSVFKQVSISYHIPLTLLLFGITVRGCAFTFRHYDAIHDRSQKLYNAMFLSSSLFTSVMLGMIAASLPSGLATSDISADWNRVYIAPWFNGYSFSVGLFATSLFGYTAAVYLAGEAAERDQPAFIKRAVIFAGLSVAAGIVTFVMAEIYGLGLAAQFFSHDLAVISLMGATSLFVPLLGFMKTRRIWASRIAVSTQVAAVVIGWFAIYFPNMLVTKEQAFSIYSSSAPDATLMQLVLALCVGSLLIFPALAYLFYVFKTHKFSAQNRPN